MLSYQWSVVAQSDAGWIYGEGIHYTEHGERVTSARLIGKAFEGVGIGYKKAAGMKVVMVAHNTIADIAGLGDRQTFMRLFKVVRRTMVMLGGDRKWRADFGNGNYAKVLVRMADTWLLAPQKQGSLANISAFLKPRVLPI